MAKWYGLKEMNEVIMGEVEKVTNKYIGYRGKLSIVLTDAISDMFRENKCFYNETDFDHHDEWFLTDLENVKFEIGKDGFQVFVEINKKGRKVDDDSIYYQVVKHRISRKSYKKLLGQKVKSLGYMMYRTNPVIELLPEKNEPTDNIFLIRDNRGEFI